MPELLAYSLGHGVRAFTTLRPGGASIGPHRGFNLAEHVGDDPGKARANRKLLARMLPSDPVWVRQVHGNRVVTAGAGLQSGREGDAVVTRDRGVVCGILTADCLPVVFASKGGTVAVAHAGWRGLAAGILESVLRALGEPPPSVTAQIGPHIARDSYQVGPEVRDALAGGKEDEESFTKDCKEGRFLCDLGALAKARLLRAGVARVNVCSLDTYRMERLCFSARRDGQRTGRMATLCWRA